MGLEDILSEVKNSISHIVKKPVLLFTTLAVLGFAGCTKDDNPVNGGNGGSNQPPTTEIVSDIEN